MYEQVVYQQFKKTFGHSPQILVKSPGRINLIGEHIDYNGGLVMPAAIDKYIFLAAAKNNQTKIRIFSLDYNQTYEVELRNIEPLEKGRWENYVLGPIAQLINKDSPISGLDIAITGNIPQGAGLSSSAALENAVIYAVNELFNLGFDRLQLALLSQKAEHNFAGVKCGIMDQMASMFGKKDNFILLNTRNLKYQYMPLTLHNFSIVLINTNVKHSLASSVYNRRRSLCEKATKLLGVEYLTDANMQQLQTLKTHFSPQDFAALEYVLEEYQRVIDAEQAIQTYDLELLGQLLFQSHYGLSKKYKVSCPELDFLVEKAQNSNSALGARMMGGGFGGCTINLIQTQKIQDFFEQVKEDYYKRFKKLPQLITVRIVDGTTSI